MPLQRHLGYKNPGFPDESLSGGLGLGPAAERVSHRPVVLGPGSWFSGWMSVLWGPGGQVGGPGGWGVGGFTIQKKKVSGRLRENPCHGGRRDVMP